MISSYLWINDIRFHYYHQNLDGGGHPIVLLHGLASNARIWELTVPYLVEAGYSLLAPDARGHGLTDKPDGDYGFDTFSRDLAAFLDATHTERPLIVGHSWGANVAIDYAARTWIGPNAPAGLVLVDGGVIQMNQMPGATWEDIRERLAPPRLAGTRLDDFLKMVQRPQHHWTPDDQAVSIYLANFSVQDDGDSEKIYPNLSFEHHIQILRAMWDFPLYERLERLNCPALAVVARLSQPGNEDERDYSAVKEASAARFEGTRPNLALTWMEDTVHDAPLQRPQELARIILHFAQSVQKK